jgi:acyl-CoA synthetase (AMP-forming)/AMP-acid ligase II
MNVVGALEAWARASPGATAVTVLDGQARVVDTRSYGELWRDVLHLADVLRQAGCEGQRLLLPAESSSAFACALYAAMIADAFPVPIPISSRPRAIARLRRIAEDAGATRALHLGSASEALATALPELTWLSTSGRDGSGSCEAAGSIGPGDDALLQYTSGSTAQPKGVRVTHGNLTANLAMLRQAMQVDETSRILTWLPMHHDMGLVGQLLLALSSGASLVLMSPLSFVRRPELWLRAIASQRATLSGAPNFAYDLVTRRAAQLAADTDLSCWTLAFCGAEKVRPATLRAFAQRVAPHGFDPASLFPCYGLAEATVFVSGGPAGRGVEAAHAPGSTIEVASCGVPAGRLAVVEPVSGVPVPDGAEGEIWVSGPHVAHGYRSAGGAGSFDARIAGDDGTPFLRTGDTGFLLDGELYVTGRLKDLIVHKGENIHPEDVEATIRQSHPRFGTMGAAFAVDDGEERVIALFETERGLQGDEMRQMIGGAMLAVADGHGLRLDDLILLAPGSLARTTSGKVRRFACRAMYLDGAFAELMSYRDVRTSLTGAPALAVAQD